MTPFADTF